MNPPPAGHFTVIVKPIPRGISRDDLEAHHLLKFGQIKALRFGSGKGISGDVMYIDYFERESALNAVKSLNGARDPGLSRLILSASISRTSLDAIERSVKAEAASASIPTKRPRLDIGSSASPVPTSATVAPALARPRGAFKYLKSRGSGDEVSIIDFRLLGLHLDSE